MEILLTSEAFVKSVSNISDNLSGKFILTAIREAQELKLRGILGDCLLDRLKELVEDEEIDADDNAAYKDLLGHCQYYLTYTAIVEITNKVSYKIANMGVTKTSDDNVNNATPEEIARQQYYYQAKADSCAFILQGWLLEHRDAFEELKECDCKRIRANLYSAATCGIWLGGARGRRTKK